MIVRRRIQALTLSAIAALGVATLPGCGSASGTSSSTGTASASTAPATNATTTSHTAPASSKKALARQLTKANLMSALLTIDDLPPGFSQDPPSTFTEKTYCDYKQVAQPNTVVYRDFTQGAGVSAQLLSATLRQYASPQMASKILAQTKKVLQTCHGEEYQGSHVSYSLMSAPKIGDGSLGVKLDVGGTSLMQNYVVAGPVLISVNGGGLTSTDASSLTALTKKQFQRYRAVAEK
ncbi:MAG TPA: hypothetical protein VG502_20265 [Flexivirga sp.]|uniref:hypothetical protein n=1 Tax=Flexivirga sp. TaxID=1962927 RepID=UPI002CD0E173|nr:hypothetical protein [Flexivirga sp.]HWC24638.1 hypothetical protein [Flexivirga sp.]